MVSGKHPISEREAAKKQQRKADIARKVRNRPDLVSRHAAAMGDSLTCAIGSFVRSPPRTAKSPALIELERIGSAKMQRHKGPASHLLQHRAVDRRAIATGSTACYPS